MVYSLQLINTLLKWATAMLQLLILIVFLLGGITLALWLLVGILLKPKAAPRAPSEQRNPTN